MGTTDNRQRYYFIDNLRWVTVVLVLIYHVFYNFNALGVFGGIGGFAEHQWQDIVGTILYPWFMTLMFLLAGRKSDKAMQNFYSLACFQGVLADSLSHTACHWLESPKPVLSY